MSIIANITTEVPIFSHQQSALAKYMCECLPWEDREKEKLKTMYARSGINTRYSVVPDFSVLSSEQNFFFPLQKNARSLEERMELFNSTAPTLCVKAIENCAQNQVNLSEITHLITVSCTGLSAPGLDIDIVQQMNLPSFIHRTSVNFMGCYAAIHALKQADSICQSDPDAIVMMICVELCTLHFQQSEEMDNLTANALFADGAAATLIVSDQFAKQRNMHGFKIRKFHSELVFKGKSDMAWRLSSTGFLMTLSAYIPQLVEDGVKNLFESAIKGLGVSQNEVAHWAIHPGGRKILEAVQSELNLSKNALSSSYEILKNYGNMSSPTILFVLKHLWDNKIDRSKPELTFGLAFGPGLTMETVILENV